MGPWLFRLLAVALLIGIPSAVKPDSALACTCGALGSPAENLQVAPVVFAGRVVSVSAVDDDDSGWARFVAEFEVLYVWKGRLHSTRFVDSTSGIAAPCGRRFEVGVEYIVYTGADDDEPGTILSSSVCSPTALLGDLEHHIEVLGEGHRPLAGMAGPEDSVVPLLPPDAGTGLSHPPGRDQWGFAGLLGAITVVLVAAGLTAIRRRARQT